MCLCGGKGPKRIYKGDSLEPVKSNKDYNPEMHSAEHILNQTMVRMFNKGRSFSNHIEKKKSKCDYHFDRNLTESEVETINQKVNEVIHKDLHVYEEFLHRDEAVNHFKLSQLPEDAGETIRIIKIGDYDACPCSGVHVKSTREIGNFKIISTSYEDGVLRIRFKLPKG
jgi:misacylated tRNA(Ala) deacylase